MKEATKEISILKKWEPTIKKIEKTQNRKLTTHQKEIFSNILELHSLYWLSQKEEKN